ncbi:flavodoxin [Streptomyces sp. A7024]|uniref:Flavodoxin n=1 Tax=Streptomyces coryli TaxID=1128680 RepID=A0A6G4TTW5_9ACTN|nr:flavodoxin domain-containing protein [Streptomyces coryli]NGN62467.1 flavodoxin [Streptomyces coryli]
MNSPRVLVAYGTKFGSTAEIADWLGQELDACDATAAVRPAAEVRDLRPYDAVVLGAGVYAGRWQRDAVRFARRHRTALSEMPVWLFSSGPLDATASEGDAPAPPTATRLAERLGAREHVVFGGKLDETARGWVARQLVKSGKGGDFRDRDQIRAWARRIAAELAREPAAG